MIIRKNITQGHNNLLALPSHQTEHMHRRLLMNQKLFALSYYISNSILPHDIECIVCFTLRLEDLSRLFWRSEF